MSVLGRVGLEPESFEGLLPEDQDARAVRQAWSHLAAPMPLHIEERLASREFFDAALDLAHCVIGEARLHGFRLTFTSLGGPYVATLLLLHPETGETTAEIAAEHETSLIQAFVGAIYKGSRRTRPEGCFP